MTLTRSRSLSRTLGSALLALCAATAVTPVTTAPAAASPAAPDPAPALALIVDHASMVIPSRGGSGFQTPTPDTGIWLSNTGPWAGGKTDATVTVDARALKSMADGVAVPCDPDGDLLGVCENVRGVVRGVPRRIGTLTLGTGRASAVGRSAKVRITAKDAEGHRAEHRVDVKFPEGQIRVDRAPRAVKGVEPGSTVETPAGFTNYSLKPVRTVRWTMTLSPGLAPASAPYRNCTSVEDAGGPGTTVTCYLKGPFAPLKSYDLDFGGLTVADSAVSETVEQDVTAFSGPPNDRAGDGPVLTATPRTRADAAVLKDLGRPGDRVSSTVATTNTTDFAVTGATLKGAVGDEVTATLSVRNNGPGSRAPTREEGTSDLAPVTLRVPDGLTVVKAPQPCYGRRTPHASHDTDDFLGLGKPGGRRYTCGGTGGSAMAKGATLSYTFTFRIDKASVDGTDAVTTVYGAADPRRADNTADLTVDAASAAGPGAWLTIGGAALVLAAIAAFLLVRRPWARDGGA
ncbi:hypothetical protein ACFW9D_31565 [Streptomyces sp. NPDC059524]|uniref:hypothetical protein n=1 Tax=Streptomyces sp. NPDC059524 TaxID=3346856 RepID=UPI0036A16AD1